jgi:hypothetical protein
MEFARVPSERVSRDGSVCLRSNSWNRRPVRRTRHSHLHRHRHRAPVAGQLTNGWRFVTGLTWALVIVAYVAVWKTSRELGLSTWWLGPFGDPQTPFVTMLPFIPPLVMVLLAVNNSRWLPRAGLGAAAVLAVIAVLDLGKVPRLALVELAIAGAGALISVASTAGRYRA